MAIDMNILNEKENGLMNRKEVVVSVSHAGEATPSKPNLQVLIAKFLGSYGENTEVVEIRSSKGDSSSRVRVNVWKEKNVGLHVKKTRSAVEKK